MSSFKMAKDEKKRIVGQLVFVKPEQCEFTDIPQLNRARESWDLAKIDELTGSIKERGILTALKGYYEGNRFKITNGRQRMTAVQELVRQGITKSVNGRPMLVPITLLEKPETNEQIAEALEDALADNQHRFEDDIQTRAQSFRTLRDLGKTLEQIGQATGYSLVYAKQLLDVSAVKPLYEAVKAGKIGVKEASAFTSTKFAKLNKEKKPLKKNGQTIFDEDKIKTALAESIRKANETGRNKVKGSDVVGIAGARSVTSKERKNQGIAWLKSLADDAENVPLEIRLVLDCFFLKRDILATIKLAKRDRIDLAWLQDVDFSSPKEKKEARKAAKKATKKIKANPVADDDDEDDDELDSSDYEEDTDE